MKYRLFKISSLLIFAAICQHIMICYSLSMPFRTVFAMDIRWQILCVLVLFTPILFLYCITASEFWTIIISSTLCSLLSIVNYHIVLFHGSPFFAADTYSIKTALNMVYEYHIVIDKLVVRILLLLGVEFVAAFFAKYISRKSHESENFNKRIISASGFILNIVILFFVFFSTYTIFPTNLIKWSWRPSAEEYGYEICFLNSCYTLNHLYVKPEHYSYDELRSYANVQYDNPEKINIEQYPDIIVILNETLCDISVLSDIPESRHLFDKLRRMPDILAGYSIVSLVGGGTNNSEYELLTSNSMGGLSFSAPFTLISMDECNSIISYLEKLGYDTLGMHCEDKFNYNRNLAYYSIGFNHVFLGPENFTRNNTYGNRRWLDVDNYMDMIEAMDFMEKGPRFAFLLTFQNHGGYDQNSTEFDTIKIKEDLGEITDNVNEYLTSIHLSIDAFISLIKCLEDSERPTIVLMVGDHAPFLIRNCQNMNFLRV